MLEKNYNFYVIDDVFDDKFASDFTIQYLEEKYANDIDKITEIKYAVLGDNKNFNLLCSCHRNKFLYSNGESDVDLETMFQEYEKEFNEKIMPIYEEFEEFEELWDCIEIPMEEDDYYEDDDLTYADRSFDYDYDYENDCEYDGDEFVNDDGYYEEENPYSVSNDVF